MSSSKKRKTTNYRPKGSKISASARPTNVRSGGNVEHSPKEETKIVKEVKIKEESPEVASNNVENKETTVRHYDSANKPHKSVPEQMSVKEKWIWALCTIGACLLVALFAKLLGGDMKNFEAHTLPPLTAPIWVYPIAWGILYFLIGLSGFFVFTSPNQTKETRKWDIIWFAINLGLNMIWPLFFYRLDMLILSTILCALVVISAGIVCYRFYYRSLTGGILYSIYVAWLLYAFYLNLGITLLNA